MVLAVLIMMAQFTEISAVVRYGSKGRMFSFSVTCDAKYLPFMKEQFRVTTNKVVRVDRISTSILENHFLVCFIFRLQGHGLHDQDVIMKESVDCI